MLEFEMTAQQALRLLVRDGLVNKVEARALRAWMRGNQPLPRKLVPTVEMVYLVQTKPPTPSLH